VDTTCPVAGPLGWAGASLLTAGVELARRLGAAIEAGGSTALQNAIHVGVMPAQGHEREAYIVEGSHRSTAVLLC
jgi:hypothetical protein